MCGVTFITFLCFSEVQQEKPVNMVRLQLEFGVFLSYSDFFRRYSPSRTTYEAGRPRGCRRSLARRR